MDKLTCYSTKAYATSSATSPLGAAVIERRLPGANGKHNITSDIEMIRMDQINTAYERMLKSDVKYRFVIDITSLA
jgi:uncharacterized zinc-type alcohol dehydrogenase-like protein